MFDLTRQEQQVILFLLVLCLFGAGVEAAVKINCRAKILPALNFDFGKIDLNRADREALMEAPGVGEKLAARILDYRSQKGRFNDLEELKNIRGLNDWRYQKLRDYFMVR